MVVAMIKPYGAKLTHEEGEGDENNRKG